VDRFYNGPMGGEFYVSISHRVFNKYDLMRHCYSTRYNKQYPCQTSI